MLSRRSQVVGRRTTDFVGERFSPPKLTTPLPQVARVQQVDVAGLIRRHYELSTAGRRDGQEYSARSSQIEICVVQRSRVRRLIPVEACQGRRRCQLPPDSEVSMVPARWMI